MNSPYSVESNLTSFPVISDTKVPSTLTVIVKLSSSRVNFTSYLLIS